MHEISLATKVIEIVEDSIRGQNVEKVTKIEVELGEFSSVTPEQFKTVFEMVAQDTIAQNAELKILLKPGRIRCLQCEYEGKAKSIQNHNHKHMLMVECPMCNSTSMEILEGKGLRVKNIKAEADE